MHASIHTFYMHRDWLLSKIHLYVWNYYPYMAVHLSSYIAATLNISLVGGYIPHSIHNSTSVKYMQPDEAHIRSRSKGTMYVVGVEEERVKCRAVYNWSS